MNPDLLLIAIVFGAVIQLAIVICFFVLCSHVAEILKAIKVIRDSHIPTISTQLQQIHASLDQR